MSEDSDDGAEDARTEETTEDSQDDPQPDLKPGTPGSPDGDSNPDGGPFERLDPGDREGDPFGSAESAFERMDVDDLDPDAVWADLTEAEERGSVTERGDSVYAEVSKHSYCEQCEYFSEPPDVACTHEGTQIIEFLDMETVRLLDCPIVEQRRELEEQG